MIRVAINGFGRIGRLLFENFIEVCGIEIPPLIEDKSLLEKIHNLSMDTEKIINDLSSSSSKNPKIIDNRILKLRRKLYKLNATIQKLEKEFSSLDDTLNSEQQLYNWWNQFWKRHPIWGGILGFLIITFLTALLTVWTENLLSEESNCSCDCCSKIEQSTSSSTNNDIDITVNIQFGY